MVTTTKTIRLVDAAKMLQLSYARAWNLVLTGRLEGQREGGRWVVTRVSVQELARHASAGKRPAVTG